MHYPRPHMINSLASAALRIALVLGSASFLGACATAKNPRDPLEPVNRAVYRFNERVDRAVLRPTARVYRAVLPQVVRTGVTNFFSNINDIPVALNNLAQGKFVPAVSDFSRVVINSSIGLLGFFDVATEAGIEKHQEDFGQTLGWWGVPDGPFLMLPLFGPSTGRDAVGLVVDYAIDPVIQVSPNHNRNQLYGTRFVNRRAELLDASTVLKTALDPYEFLREAYLQRRRNLVYDGKPPPEKDPVFPVLKPDEAVEKKPAEKK